MSRTKRTVWPIHIGMNVPEDRDADWVAHHLANKIRPYLAQVEPGHSGKVILSGASATLAKNVVKALAVPAGFIASASGSTIWLDPV